MNLDERELEASLAAMMKRAVWLTPEQIVERKRYYAEKAKAEASAKARATRRWGDLPTIVLVQDARRAEAVLLERLREDGEWVDEVWRSTTAYHARLSALRGRYAR
jgi:hypothetical protein